MLNFYQQTKLTMKKICLLVMLWLTASVLPSMAQQYADTLRVLCIGNSFTYFSDAHLMLRDLALSQNHFMEVNAQLVGGYTFHRHLNRDETMSALVYHQFDCAFLQDQSRTPALYAQDPVRCRLIAEDAAELAERVRLYSPNARVWIEQTWSYTFEDCGHFGTLEHFDALLREGAKLMAERAHTEVSPIGEAFIICRAEHPEINLYFEDNKHQSAYGSYLKACVNYLLIYGSPFAGQPAECGLDAKACAHLRKIAERVVMPIK